MDSAALAAIVSAGASIIVQLIGLIQINKLLTYRVEQLEKSLEKQSASVETVDALTIRVEYNEKEIDKIHKKLEKI